MIFPFVEDFSIPLFHFLIIVFIITKVSFDAAGIEIDEVELARFVEHVDKDNNGIITFEEWRDFLLLYPHEATLENIYQHWERVCLVDIGEQAVIPEGISKHVHRSRYFIAGGIAGAASRTATAPLDRLKVVLQIQTGKASIMPAVTKIWQRDGLLGFFRGNGLNVVKVAPESAIKFYAYEMLKNVIGESRGNKSDIGTAGRLFAGGMAGAIAQIAIYPLDLIKTRLQTCASEGGRAPNLGTLTKDIWIQEGPRAFYRGLVPSLLGMIPYAGIDLTAYDTLKDISKKYIISDHGMIFLLLFISLTYKLTLLAYLTFLCSFLFHRTWSSSTTWMWDSFRSSWSYLCLSTAGYSYKVLFCPISNVFLWSSRPKSK